MPNYVKNRIRLVGEQADIDRLLEAVKFDDKPIGTLDFNKVIPMPESLNIESGSREHDAIDACLTAVNPDMPDYGAEKLTTERFHDSLDRLNECSSFRQYSGTVDAKTMKDADGMELDEFLRRGKQYIDNFTEYGSTTWYDWAIKHWGTKWNSFDKEELDNNTIEFDTAWSRAMPVLTKLAEMFPEIHFDYAWADEDVGVNVGECEFENGELIFEHFPDCQSKEAYEMTADVWGTTLADMGSFLTKKQTTMNGRRK